MPPILNPVSNSVPNLKPNIPQTLVLTTPATSAVSTVHTTVSPTVGSFTNAPMHKSTTKQYIQQTPRIALNQQIPHTVISLQQQQQQQQQQQFLQHPQPYHLQYNQLQQNIQSQSQSQSQLQYDQPIPTSQYYSTQHQPQLQQIQYQPQFLFQSNTQIQPQYQSQQTVILPESQSLNVSGQLKQNVSHPITKQQLFSVPQPQYYHQPQLRHSNSHSHSHSHSPTPAPARAPEPAHIHSHSHSYAHLHQQPLPPPPICIQHYTVSNAVTPMETQIQTPMLKGIHANPAKSIPQGIPLPVAYSEMPIYPGGQQITQQSYTVEQSHLNQPPNQYQPQLQPQNQYQPQLQPQHQYQPQHQPQCQYLPQHPAQHPHNMLVSYNANMQQPQTYSLNSSRSSVSNASSVNGSVCGSISANMGFVNQGKVDIKEKKMMPMHKATKESKDIYRGKEFEYITWDNKRGSKSWSCDEDILLRKLKEVEKMNWFQIASYFPDRTTNGCQFRWRRLVSKLKIMDKVHEIKRERAGEEVKEIEEKINEVNKNDDNVDKT